MAIFPETKLRILRLLAKSDQTPSELARALEMSIPAVQRQLEELADLKMIKKAGFKAGKTRPFVKYSLDKGFVIFIKALPEDVKEEFLEVDENLRLHLRIWSVPQKAFCYYVEKFWWQLEPHLDDIDAVAVYGSVAKGEAREDSDIDILILVNKNKKLLEKLFGAKMIKKNKKESKMVMSQVFESRDFESSLKQGSKFALQAIKHLLILYDPGNILERWKT